ncbi:Fe3+-dicitrate outer membrane receptor [Nitritalea halalkaliphila LW7]|uniref:Fe3+-dicitrate outer membrane receptor n=1 Tax=Nitritalea halalkaliphila LW7 TaxID=1189621 RepID=I5C3N2_9BACT|nr:TonB-dependent receptor [Nitritalea halalkaliphila]EIM76434.1 Fe3+-dicitrate outer membrane receptor [Nitritalea halalkaliphila LW7]
MQVFISKPIWRVGVLCFFFLIGSIRQVSATMPNDRNEKEEVLRGVVLGTSGEPVPFANVQVVGTIKGAVADAEGRFVLSDLANGRYQMKFSAVGYRSVTREVEILNGEIQELEIIFSEMGVNMPEITIISSKDRLFSKTPGSVNYIDRKELDKINPISIAEALRRTPGVNVVEDELTGMRLSMGIRGLDPNMSRSVLILEDGVPVALNPYGEPEMYYTPPVDRMEGMEILKGSGQILYGPRTVGGVVNFITANPPESAQGRVNIQGGQGGFFSGLLNYGNTVGNTGYHISLLRRSADNLGPTSFGLTDLNAKFLFDLNERSELGMKIGVYDETSNATYIGMNQLMFERGENDFDHLAPDDRLDVRRYSLSVSHKYKLSDRARLRTIAYGYTTERNWSRQDFAVNATNTAPDDWTGVFWGDLDVPGGAIFMRDGTGNRDRSYEVAGVEPRLELEHDLFQVKNELITGVRLHYERGFIRRVNGTQAGVRSGELVEDEIRTGHAFSAYFQNTTNVTNKLDVNVGLRYENYVAERDILRRPFAGVVRDTVLVATNVVSEFIPGAGFNFRPVSQVNIFGGVHRGFAPPRVQDAITGDGEPLELDAESSVNIELGVRTQLFPWLFVELAGFRMDFSNQIIPVAQSLGGSGFGVVNAGRTIHEGVEAMVNFEISRLLKWEKVNLFYDANITYVNSVFGEDRIINDVNVKGFRTPYAPEWLVNTALTLETEMGLGGRLTLNHVSEQFTDQLNTIEPRFDGRIGLMPAFTTVDATLLYDVKKWNSRFNLTIKNLTNERFIASRRPEGIRMGLPRFITAGYEFRF